MKYGILLAMGMTAATALVGADRAVNAFLAVDGDGVSIDDDGSIVCDRSAAGSVTVSARPGWLVNGRESVSVDPKRGSGLKVTSKLGEDDEHVHVFPQTVEDDHLEDIVLVAEATPASQIAMYALPDTSTVVSASATHKVDKRGKHRVTTTYYPCVCGEVHDPQGSISTYEVEPDHYEWTASGAGQTVESSTWTGQMSKGLRQSISFHVTGKRDECAACTCTASTNVLVDVHELSVTNDLYLGLDRTDFGRTNPVVKVAGALIAPEPTGSSAYSWIECGICSFTGRTDQAEVRYFAPDPDRGSASYLAEPLTVRGTATNAEGLSASANCTTNFTVVKVDVTIGGVGEDKEETEGAFVQYVQDAANGVISVEGTNKMVSVSFSCLPNNLPTNEVVTISCTPPGELYEVLFSGELLRITSTNYPACEIAGHQFMLHGHDVSAGFRDGQVMIAHKKSGAIDMAKYTVINARVKKVSFSGDGYRQLVRDTDCMFDYSAPHYYDYDINGRIDGALERDFPVCYVRNTTMMLAADIAFAPSETAGGFFVKAVGPENISLPPIMGTYSQGIISVPETATSTNMPDRVCCYDKFVLEWFVSCDGGKTWVGCGSSENELYCTWAAPKASPLLQTFVHIGCSAAEGSSGIVGVHDDQIQNMVWNRFKGRTIKRVGDNKLLTYYGYLDGNENGVWEEGVDVDYNDPDRCKPTSAVNLVLLRNGQCRSWADMYASVLAAQGLRDVNGAEVRIVGLRIKHTVEGFRTSGFAIRNWLRGAVPFVEHRIVSFDAGVDGLAIPSQLLVDCAVDAAGVPGQGTSPNPPSGFGNHFITKIGMLYYDPSYGIGPYIDRKLYEDSAFDGFIYKDEMTQDYMLRRLPANDGNTEDGSDEICEWDD